jgi:hydrogenase maturation protein HypF
LGGYHLVCDAGNLQAVAELRRRKQREEKPLAIMVANALAAKRICRVHPDEKCLLENSTRPIVLLHKRRGIASHEVCEAVAPGNPHLGVMLPYTPLHHLLMKLMPGTALVMTSGNLSDEPIAFEDDDAIDRLGGIADVFLCHNRPIHVRCDDSVVRMVAASAQPIRRSRGYAPLPIELPTGCPLPTLAVGGQLKNTFALGVDQHGFLSHHLGDLDHFAALEQFQRDVHLYEQLFGIRPAAVVHDSHPDYATTRYAQQRAAEQDIQLLSVQHHHAHMASCMAENGLNELVIGITFDGTGFGLDEASDQPTVWGGEFLLGDYRGFHRLAHLRNIALPGGDQAAREPWRMAVSHLLDAGEGLGSIESRISKFDLRTVEQMIACRFNSPQTSSMGRLFDAVASIAGVRDVNAYEGQAAIQLEWLAAECEADGVYPLDIRPSRGNLPCVIDTRPMIRAIADEVRQTVRAGRIARRFHSTLVEMAARVCRQIRAKYEVETVVFSGGVFLNTILAKEVFERLSSDGFRVYRHRLVPPNDGGLCLGQLAVAAATLNARSEPDSACSNTAAPIVEKLTAMDRPMAHWNSPGNLARGTDQIHLEGLSACVSASPAK